jgi:2,4'-dihydroxyacetophenone dioxygenase
VNKLISQARPTLEAAANKLGEHMSTLKRLSNTAQGMMRAAVKDETLFLDTNSLPWTPWVMDGVEYKLLHWNEVTDRATVLFRVPAGSRLPVHEHIDEVEAFIIKGCFAYEADEINPAREVRELGFMYEPKHTTHKPVIPEETLMLVIFQGPVAGYDNGDTPVITGGRDLYEWAKVNNAVPHLKPPKTLFAAVS